MATRPSLSYRRRKGRQRYGYWTDFTLRRYLPAFVLACPARTCLDSRVVPEIVLGLVPGNSFAGGTEKLKVVRQDRLQPAADFTAVIGPDALAPIAVATGLRAQQVE